MKKGGFDEIFRVLKEKQRFSTGLQAWNLVMYVLPNQHMMNRLGISVSKKVGNSVVRHRLTRLIRESYRLNEEKFDRNLDIVVIARNSAKDRSYQEIESAFMNLAQKHAIAGGTDEETSY